MVNVEQVLEAKYPRLKTDYPQVVYRGVVGFLNRLLHVRDINYFLERYGEYRGLDFIEKIFEFLNVDYAVKARDRENIPPTGRVMIVANHPLGALDALALIKLVGEVRSDVKIVANDVLLQFEQLNDLLIPIDNMNEKVSKKSVEKVLEALNNDEAVIIFPSGEVSRGSVFGVKDGQWKSGFVFFAKKTKSKILPVYIDAKNSRLFYAASFIYKHLSTALLAHEMFNKRAKTIHFRIGEVISENVIGFDGISSKEKAKMLKKHLLRISKGKKGVFATEHAIAHPESRQLIKYELKNSPLLGATKDNKKIFLVDYTDSPVIMKEIGRLREISFRKVGEGTGGRRDLDKFDKYYKQLVLWDDESLEIVGAYRIGEVDTIREKYGRDGLYSSTLFEFREGFDGYLYDAIELGRSFVQPRYWGSKALDYLWQGIGAYLKTHPNIRYMYGPVSISNVLGHEAIKRMVYFYSHYFPGVSGAAVGRMPFTLSSEEQAAFKELFAGDNYTEDFKRLKEELAFFGATVPTLYKQYSELCEEGGVKFFDFNIDREFGDCVDGFIMVEIDKITEAKRKRYIGE
jgi:1-acyl-sn-glycerol-3-phosphate acyltransferase